MHHPTRTCPIAIVGMACRYPDADSVEQLFENTLAQRQSFRRIPEVRMSSGYFDPSGKDMDCAYATQAALLKGFDFDRAWFRVSQKSHEVTDQTHWLALTVARETIEDIRFRKGEGPDNEAVRVVVGNSLAGEFSRAHVMRSRWPYVRNVLAQHLRHEQPHLHDAEFARLLGDLEVRYKSPFPVPNEDFLAGGLSNTIAGRICNHFNFKGGGYTVDGACASSLLAVTDACSALVAGDADMVLAGGVDLSIDPFELIGFSRTAALARDEMRVYDVQSQGFWPGEGCGFVALMRYQDALKQCTHIHAVIHGWGISSDGRGGLTRPESEGQTLAVQRCYRRSGYGIESVGYFEGHGTGTRVGDATELKTLIDARNNSGNPIEPAVISSIKANIGHTKAAAGLAGLLRTVKCLGERILPPTTACRQPHPLLIANPHNLMPASQPREWRSDGLERRAGVSAMGFGGINSHITLAEVPEPVRTTVPIVGEGRAPLERLRTFQDVELFPFATVHRKDLARLIDRVVHFAHACSRSELTDLAVDLGNRFTNGGLTSWKAAVVAGTPEELHNKLIILKKIMENADDSIVHLSVADGVFLSSNHVRGRIGLMFSGQGAPARPEGGIHARRFDEARDCYRQAALDDFQDRSDTDFAQPAIATASLGGLALLRRLGLQGDVALGHSLGELSALHWAGCMEASELLTIARARGRAMVADPRTHGAMAALAADRERTIAAIDGYENLHVANINAPSQTVVSGDRRAVETLVDQVRRQGMNATLLRVRQAFHTPAMAGVATIFSDLLQEFRFRPPERTVISTVTGLPLPNDTDLTRYLGDQLVSPVQFLTAVTQAAGMVDLLLEVGPGQVLTHLVNGFSDTPAISLDVGGDSMGPFLHAVAALFVLGRAPRLSTLFKDRFARRFNWNWNPQFLKNPCESIPTLPERLSLPKNEEKSAEKNVTGKTVAGEPDATPVSERPTDGDTTDRLRQIIAEHTGLPPWTIQDSSRMLADLHLNSITVGEIIARLAASTGLRVPADLTEFANASLAEITTALERRPGATDPRMTATTTTPHGIGSWVRCFHVVPASPPPLEDNPVVSQGIWEGFGNRLAREEALLRRLNSEPHGHGVILWPGAFPEVGTLPVLLQGAQRCIERARQLHGSSMTFVVVQQGWGGSGFARSFFLEHPDIRTLVINLPPTETMDSPAWIIREIDGGRSGFGEMLIDEAGQRTEPYLKPVPWSSFRTTRELIGGHDVVLITGGGKGIGAECGLQLARRTGCALLILGRSVPQTSTELFNNLARLRMAHPRISYQRADVTNAAQVADAVARGVAELNAPVTAMIHGAGLNHPCLVTNLTIADLKATLAPKIDGLDNLLAAIDPGSLKLLVGFGSIIARTGLQGEADYALANEWLGHRIERFQSLHPHCRCLAMEWSVWSGTGMGQRLGRLEALGEQGIAPISIDDGVQAFLRLVQTPDLPPRLIVSDRFGNPPTVVLDTPPLRQFRFIDTVPVYYPETELIAECHLSPQSDPYLDDHVLDGERLFPAVLALEAMAEAAVTLMWRQSQAADLRFFAVVFRKAIVVPGFRENGPTEPLTLRLLALADTDGTIRLAIRCSTTDFQLDHVAARCTLGHGDRSHETDESDIPELPTEEIRPFDPDRALYRNVLFQQGRFKRIQGYRMIEARRCSGQIAIDGATQWFSSSFPQGFLLGDPGARDAALHGIQACIPHKVVIPIAVEEIEIGTLSPGRPYRMYAREIEDRGHELVNDLVIFDRDGRLIERWRRITMRVMGELPGLRLNSPLLMASFFERQVAADLPQAGLKVAILPQGNGQKERTRAIDPHHRPDGKPDPVAAASFQSIAYSGDWKLAVTGIVPLGCDLQQVRLHDTDRWQNLLGTEGLKLARVIAEMTRERLDVAATRVWTAREAMKKAGLPSGAPLTVIPEAHSRWVVFQSGASAIFSSRVEADRTEEMLCVTVALRSEAGLGQKQPVPDRYSPPGHHVQ
ncbi:MAG: SDR family NAD(P)-dependent oxidoreductase [Magnetococcales bacterium]|nr:SDR family NAD(P)-dependent oxidoreductase [Magnetococcales bacterium]